ncbi:hypothetical protein HYC85_019986 [Camellia sinensis]|uniref:C2 domain-containing protein n=1 Tax=Camellia sinensis TaxID=4442 RepID=A0A7J7GSD4_CAMSI|nr:hypothetical protein HYC85_019986 [Camellia sinensis]
MEGEQFIECRKFKVTLISAFDLEDVRKIFRMKVYATVSFGDDDKTEKRTKADEYGETSPRWGSSMQYTIGESAVIHHGLILVIKLYCKRKLGDRYIGELLCLNPSLFQAFKLLQLSSFLSSGGAYVILSLSSDFGNSHSNFPLSDFCFQSLPSNSEVPIARKSFDQTLQEVDAELVAEKAAEKFFPTVFWGSVRCALLFSDSGAKILSSGILDLLTQVELFFSRTYSSRPRSCLLGSGIRDLLTQVHASIKNLFDCATQYGGSHSADVTWPVQKGCDSSQGMLRFSYRFGDKMVIERPPLWKKLLQSGAAVLLRVTLISTTGVDLPIEEIPIFTNPVVIE